MDYDEYDTVEGEVGFVAPAPPVRPVARKIDVSEPGVNRNVLRLQVWDQQRKRQLGFKWKRDLKTEILENAAAAANAKISAADAPFTVTIAREGSGPVLELRKKGTGALVARSQPIPPGRVTSVSAERIVLDFCDANGVRHHR